MAASRAASRATRVVVIGAGVGGATAAALLAKDGFDVTVLEAHVYAGGCAGTFFHKGYRFDAGATVAGGFQPGGPHEIVERMLNIKFPVRRIEPAWEVHLPDRAITVWGDQDKWADERAEKLPALSRFWGLQRYAAETAWRFAARLPEFPPTSLGDALRFASKIRPDMIPIAPMALASMGSVLDVLGVRDRAARTFVDAQLLISAQVTAERANALYGAIAIDLPRVGVHHVHGGIGNLAATLVDAVRSYGGRVIFRRAVTKIERRADGTFRLDTNKGESYEADVVLANLTPWALNALLGEQSPESLRGEVQRRRDTWGAFTLYLGVPESALPHTAEHFQIVQDYSVPLGEGNSVFISISDAISDKDTDQGEARAPQGFRAVTLSTHTRIAPWWELRDSDPDAYGERINAYRDKLLAGAERAIPGLAKNAALILPGTPAAFQRFTRRPRGMVGGFAMTSLLSARSPHTGVPNLWLVGDSIFPGQSTAGVTAGALRVAAEVQRRAGRQVVVNPVQRVPTPLDNTNG
jgi:C-3',4' desaturase CrtD